MRDIDIGDLIWAMLILIFITMTLSVELTEKKVSVIEIDKQTVSFEAKRYDRLMEEIKKYAEEHNYKVAEMKVKHPGFFESYYRAMVRFIPDTSRKDGESEKEWEEWNRSTY